MEHGRQAAPWHPMPLGCPQHAEEATCQWHPRDGSKPGVRRKKMNHIGYVHDNPVRRGLASRAVDRP